MASAGPPDFARLIAAVSGELATRAIPFMVIGGQAVLLHGDPRLTQDVDLTLARDPSAFGEVLGVCEAIGLRPLAEDVAAFTRRTYVLPAVDDVTGVRVDFIFSTTPYERQAIERAVRIEIGHAVVPFAAAEDLLLHKVFAGRPRDLEDAAGVVRRKGDALDWSYIENWAAQFATVPGRERILETVADLRRGSAG